jgi:tungstate transport system substrate-binding protein
VKFSSFASIDVLIALFLFTGIVFLTGSSARAADSNLLLMASTIGPIDAGIVDAIESAFEKESGIRVRHVGAGTGAALVIAEGGNVDLALVHAKLFEEKFVEEGYGTLFSSPTPKNGGSGQTNSRVRKREG